MGPAANLAAVLTMRHDALRRNVGGARRGTVEGVHQARVATRRLREAVPVAAVGLSGVRKRRLQRELRTMTRALGGVRECDVALGMLTELDLEAQPHLAGLVRLWRRHLRERRRALRQDLVVACSDHRVTALGARLDALVAARVTSTDERWRTRLARQLEDRARRLRARVEGAGPLFVGERLHEVRIAAKQLRYALELVGECRLASVSGYLTRLKRVQDLLGRLHDLDVLAAQARDVTSGCAPGSPMVSAADQVCASIDRDARQRHAIYLRRRDALIRLADQVGDAVAPRVRQPRPAGSASPPGHHVH